MFKTRQSDIKYRTQATMDLCQSVYDHFNQRLHGGLLHGAQFSFQPLRKSLSKFKAAQVIDDQDQFHDQIILCSNQLMSVDPLKILAAIDDAMISQGQYINGKTGRDNYRNRERAEMAKEIGLYPSSTGAEGGKEIGDCISYYIIEGSSFQQAAQELLAGGFKMAWEEIKPKPKGNESKSGKRVKYICPLEGCKVNALSHHDATIDCGIHHIPLIPQE
jgi:hypothetical protein